MLATAGGGGLDVEKGEGEPGGEEYGSRVGDGGDEGGCVLVGDDVFADGAGTGGGGGLGDATGFGGGGGGGGGGGMVVV